MRYLFIDYLKTFSITVMVIFHFVFVRSVFYLNDTSYLLFSPILLDVIRFLFISIAGFNTALVLNKVKDSRVLHKKMLKRLFYLFLVCFFISGLTYILDPVNFIFFGVIHLITFCYFLVYISKFFRSSLSAFIVFTFMYFIPQLLTMQTVSRTTYDVFPLFPYSLYFYFGYILYNFICKYFTKKDPNWASLIASRSMMIYLIHPFLIFISLHLYYM